MGNETETVAVPIGLLKGLIEPIRESGFPGRAEALELLLPKPKPRLVAVTFEQWRDVGTDYWYNDQPDLLGTLYTVLSEGIENEVINVGQAVRLKAAIRDALGVNDG